MSTQHTINPPLVVNSCGIVVQNTHPREAGGTQHEENQPGTSRSGSDAYFSSAETGSTISSPEAISPTPPVEHSGGGNRRRKRYSQQDMFEYFVKDSERKKKEGKQFLTMIKCIAQAQNINVPNFDSSSSESEMDFED